MEKRINKMILSVAGGVFLLAGCAINPIAMMNLSPPVVSGSTVYTKGPCDIVAIDAESGQIKWRIETKEAQELDICEQDK